MHFTNSLLHIFLSSYSSLLYLYDFFFFLRYFVCVDFNPHLPSLLQNRIFLQAVPQSLSSMPHPLLHPLSAPGACITRIQFLVLSVPTDVLYIYVINLVTTNQSVSLARIPYLRTQVRRKKKFNGIALIVTLVHSITFLCTILHFL